MEGELARRSSKAITAAALVVLLLGFASTREAAPSPVRAELHVTQTGVALNVTKGDLTLILEI